MHGVIQQILDTKLLPLYYNDDYQKCKDNILACYHAGVKVFEFTNRGDYAIAHFARLKSEFYQSNINILLGVGTIYTVEDARSFKEAGADFIIQPVCTSDVAEYCKSVNTPWIPGVMTLNEIYQASLLGADLIKVFPGNVLGKEYIKSIRGPLPKVNLMVTGGVEAAPEDVKAWLKAGVNVCGLGSQLYTRTPGEVTEVIKNILNEINE
jgi:2-dehydro-3-deoxyphosphogluconate aldolase / (4S)-4-hydroxy-2-oxoglutarate aldolase